MPTFHATVTNLDAPRRTRRSHHCGDQRHAPYPDTGPESRRGKGTPPYYKGQKPCRGLPRGCPERRASRGNDEGSQLCRPWIPYTSRRGQSSPVPRYGVEGYQIPVRARDTNHHRPSDSLRESKDNHVALGLVPSGWALPSRRPQPHRPASRRGQLHRRAGFREPSWVGNPRTIAAQKNGNWETGNNAHREKCRAGACPQPWPPGSPSPSLRGQRHYRAGSRAALGGESTLPSPQPLTASHCPATTHHAKSPAAAR